MLDAAVQFAMFVEMRFKHELACWRPIDLSPQVQPMITTPGHGSFPSGHCVEAYVIKEVLQALLHMNHKKTGQTNLRRQFDRTAARIATNRVVAGVHFPIDSIAGRLLGTVLGRYFVYCCGAKLPPDDSPPWHSGAFNGPKCPPQEEFEPDSKSILDEINRPPYYDYKPVEGLDKLEPAEQVLYPLWAAATKELSTLDLPY